MSTAISVLVCYSQRYKLARTHLQVNVYLRCAPFYYERLVFQLSKIILQILHRSCFTLLEAEGADLVIGSY